MAGKLFKSLLHKSLLHGWAVLLCCLFALVTYFSISGYSTPFSQEPSDTITIDEISHLSSGLYYIKTGKYFFNPEHPPLAKDAAGLALVTRGFSMPTITNDASKQDEAGYFPAKLEVEGNQWEWGRRVVFESSNTPEDIVRTARAGVIMLNTILLFFLYLFISQLWSKRAGIISIMLVGTSATFLAHSALANTDTASALLQVTALLVFSIYMKQSFLKERYFGWMFCAFVVFTSLALLAKFSSLLLVPFMLGAGVLMIILHNTLQKRNIRQYLVKFVGIYVLFLVLMCGLIVLFYIPHVMNMNNVDMREAYEGDLDALPSFMRTVSLFLIEGNAATKAIYQYLYGLTQVFGRVGSPYQRVQFFDKFYSSEGAGALYFPVLYLFKTQIAFLLLYGFTGIHIVRKLALRKQLINAVTRHPGLAVLMLYSVFFFAISITSSLQIGIRHIMPFIVLQALILARVADSLWHNGIWRSIRYKHVFSAGFVFIIMPLVLSFPHYISYYNSASKVLGKEGYEIATDSNYDWGQDVGRLAKWVEENNVSNIYLDLFTTSDWDYYFKDNYTKYSIEGDNYLPPSGSYLAVSVTFYQLNKYNHTLENKKKYDYHFHDDIVARAGTSIFIIKVP
ncbi:MAG: ArnT family glycosyltransferase [Candidatus Dojkabacteria bacterium]